MAITVLVNSPFTDDIKKIGDTININFTLTNSESADVSYKINVTDASNNILQTLVPLSHFASPYTLNHDIVLTQLIYDNKIVVEISNYGSVVIADFSTAMTYNGVLGSFYYYSYDFDTANKDMFSDVVLSNSGY